MMVLVETKRVSEAVAARCDECGDELGCQYWTLSKSIALHRRGTGHKVTLYAFPAEEL